MELQNNRRTHQYKDMRTRLARFVRWVKSHISLVAFAGGFVLDALTLKRIDLLYENFVFVSYLIIALVGIFLVHGVETGAWRHRVLVKYRSWLPALVQFPIGGLFSGFLIFYVKSASLLTSWPFLAILTSLFVGNEFFRKRYERLVFQVGIYFFVLMTYFILLVPALLGTLGVATFVLAGLGSLFMMALILQLVMRLFPDVYKTSVRALWLAVGGIYAGFNVLYFTNVIPPVPLALKSIGIYHSAVRVGSEYRVTYEVPPWYAPWRSSDTVFHRMSGDAAYCFSAVYAPTQLRTDIRHSWQYKNSDGAWVRDSTVPFQIAGGREGGYRGFTIKQNITPGEWRCVVETSPRGQVLGEERFTIVEADTAPALVEGVQ